MKHGRHHCRKLSADNYGVSFIELVISILLIAILTSPLLHGFIVSARLSSEAGMRQQQTEEAQNIMENIKQYSIEDIARFFNYPEAGQAICEIRPGQIIYEAEPDGAGSFTRVAEGEQSCIRSVVTDENGTYYIYDFREKYNRPCYYAMESVKIGREYYDFIITIDGTAYRGTDSSGNPTGHNTVRMPLLCNISGSGHAVAMQTGEAEMAAFTLYTNHIYYCMEQEQLHRDDEVPFSITYHTMEEIRAQLECNIRINISKPAADVLAEVVMEFSCTAYDGCGTAEFPVLARGILKEGKSLYVFYNPFSRVNVSVSRDPSLPGETDIFLYRQNLSGVAEISASIDPLPPGVNLYCNADFPGYVSEPVKQVSEWNRIYMLKVQLYKAGEGFRQEALVLEMESAKGV